MRAEIVAADDAPPVPPAAAARVVAQPGKPARASVLLPPAAAGLSFCGVSAEPAPRPPRRCLPHAPSIGRAGRPPSPGCRPGGEPGAPPARFRTSDARSRVAGRNGNRRTGCRPRRTPPTAPRRSTGMKSRPGSAAPKSRRRGKGRSLRTRFGFRCSPERSRLPGETGLSPPSSYLRASEAAPGSPSVSRAAESGFFRRSELLGNSPVCSPEPEAWGGAAPPNGRRRRIPLRFPIPEKGLRA